VGGVIKGGKKAIEKKRTHGSGMARGVQPLGKRSRMVKSKRFTPCKAEDVKHWGARSEER